ncbi:MAG: cytochrome c maturation protein CcmE [candidate division Zixibacteria bacterium]|nr:cytochrome c maturation protein CcmE [candidate division Zixibacteria bacterium]
MKKLSGKYRAIIGVVVVVIFGGLGIWSLVDTATPYVGFEKARLSHLNVQIIGFVDYASSHYDENTGVFSFYIYDENNDRMLVNYTGIKPANFEQAKSVVCIGIFKDDVFNANNLLVKCPSKYQGNEK